MNWDKYGIDVSKVRGGKSTCPKCSQDRKNKSDLCLSVDIKNGLFNCHNCGFKGNAGLIQSKKEYTKPLPRLQKVSDKAISFFESRGITNNTLLRFGVTEAREWMPQFNTESDVICFNYQRDGELVNIKFRGVKKSFKLAKDAELIFYNLDSLKDSKIAVIVEGEIDCLSMYEAGVYSSVSVPNGASKGNQKLEYLDNCWQDFEDKEKIIIAVDNDEAGKSLKEELARRLGKERCWFIQYPEGCKDANEILLKYGKDVLKTIVENAITYPLDGVLTVADLADSVIDMFENGYPDGAKAGIIGLDEHISFVGGQLTMVTGIPGSGKDEFINDVAVGLAENHGWRFGVVGFEEPASITVTKMIEKRGKKSFNFRKNPNDRLTRQQFEEGLLFTDEYFKFINTDEVTATVDTIIEKAEQLVKKYGIKALIISPWNCFEHAIPQGSNETLYVSQVLGKLITFLKKYDVHCFLIAHPTKIMKDKVTGKYEVPTLYHISGSANFFNKTHNGISVYRDFSTNVTTIYIQKVKWSWLGKLGFCSFNYNTMTRQYEPII